MTLALFCRIHGFERDDRSEHFVALNPLLGWLSYFAYFDIETVVKSLVEKSLVEKSHDGNDGSIDELNDAWIDRIDVVCFAWYS